LRRVGQKVQNQSCSGRVCVFAKSYRKFPIIDGMTRPEAVFYKTRLNDRGFFWSGFPKDQKIISKEEVMDGRVVSGNF
jgi:hypothetical protein